MDVYHIGERSVYYFPAGIDALRVYFSYPKGIKIGKTVDFIKFGMDWTSRMPDR